MDGVLNKDKAMDNVEKHNVCTNVPSSQTFRSYKPGVFNLSDSVSRIENFNEACASLSYTAVFRIVRWFPHSQGTLCI
jgi:hypothetical protein